MCKIQCVYCHEPMRVEPLGRLVGVEDDSAVCSERGTIPCPHCTNTGRAWCSLCQHDGYGVPHEV